jgi:hypothetical protein
LTLHALWEITPDMNDVTRRYIVECQYGTVDLQAKSVADLLPPTYAQSYGTLLLPRPLFVNYSEVSAFASDLVTLFGILTSLPDRLYDGDLRRYCTALGMDERLADLARIGATDRPPLYARADAYHNGQAFKVLELNVGSELGGIDTAQLNRAYLRNDPFRGFAERYQLGYVDTAQRLAELLRQYGRRVTPVEPVIALIEGRDALVEHEHVFVAIQEAMRRHGIELLLGEIHQLGNRNGKLTLHGVELDVVLRYFAAGQLLDDPDGRDQLQMIVDADANGRTALFTPLDAALYASKGSLGMLHEPRVRAVLTDEERAVADRAVPWTRVLSTAPGAVTGSAVDELTDYCMTHRESLILKPGLGYGGVGAVLGRENSDQQWREALQAVQEQDFVVQEIVVPAAEPVYNPETEQVEDWRANWGIFVTDAGYGGAFVRALKPTDGSVISYSNPGTRGTCVFTHPGEEPEPPRAQ